MLGRVRISSRMCIIITRYSYFHHGGVKKEKKVFFALLLLDQSTISICRHDNKHLTFAHLFQSSRQRDQVRVTLVTSFP